MNERIRVFASATVANVACGFDILGFAVDQPGDVVELKRTNGKGLRIVEITGDAGRLSYEPSENTASLPILKFLDKIGEPNMGLELKLHKQMPFGSGMGSSAASAVAGVFAANQLLGEPLSRSELLPFAMEGERLACGSPHADNVAPALYGGFVLIRSYDPLDVIPLPAPPELYCTILHPDIEVNTKDARLVLRKQIRMAEAVVQWGNVGGLVAGLFQKDYGLIARSLQDVIVEPVRSLLIPGFEQAKDAALAAGALGCGISGSGPSIFSLSTDKATAEAAGRAKQEIFKSLDIHTTVYVSQINQHGPLVS